MIQIIGGIDHESFAEFDRQLTAIERKLKKVHIKLMSDGGDAMAGIAFFDRIKASPLEITITAHGLVGSAAVLVFAAGDHRVMMPNSCLYVHEEGVNFEDLPVSHAKRELKRYVNVENKYNYLMASVSLLSTAKWQQLNEEDTYIKPELAQLWGICDEVLK